MGKQERYLIWRVLEERKEKAERCWLCASTVGRWLDEADEAAEHDHGEGKEMKPSKRFGQSLGVANQAAKVGNPGDAALDHPSTRQKDKALLGFGKLHHFQSYALIGSILGRLPTGVSLVPGRPRPLPPIGPLALAPGRPTPPPERALARWQRRRTRPTDAPRCPPPSAPALSQRCVCW